MPESELAPGPDALLSGLRDGHARFLALVADVRPDLHRYCARMTGSIADGEDIVQETLARAYYALAELDEVPPLRTWLFHIAHRRAIDHLRRYERRMGQELGTVADEVAHPAGTPEEAVAREQAMRAAVSRFLELPPAPRSAVILKDVLGHSLDEIAALLELSLPAVKAAVHRGRMRLREESGAVASDAAATQRGSRRASPTVARYVALFNARDWDAVRAMLADDVRLDVVAKSQRRGRRHVSSYFTNYDALSDWHLGAAWLENREVVAVRRHPDDALPAYFVELSLSPEGIARIRDFRYVSYILRDGYLEESPLDR